MSDVSNNFLEEFYKDIYTDLPVNPSREPYKFTAEISRDVPDEFYSETIHVTKRQLIRPSVRQDNILVHLNKLSSRALGLFILSCVLSQDKTKKILKLNKNISQVHSIIIEKPHYNTSKRLYHHFTEYYYRAKDPQDFLTKYYWPLAEDAFELNHHIIFNLVNEAGDYNDRFSNRNDLVIKGSTAGLTMVAEYLLNLSLISSKTNYITLSDDIKVDDDSCTGRIEITHNASQN